MRRSRILWLIVATLVLLGVSTGAAMSAQVQYVENYGLVMSIGGAYNGQVLAGVNRLLINGNPADAFCIDLSDPLSFIPKEYDVVPLGDAPDAPHGPMGAEKAELLGRLWNMGYHPEMMRAEAAALQGAFWEVVLDGDNVLDVSQGDFSISTLERRNDVQALLEELEEHQGITPMVGLTNPCFQDFATAAQIPAPEAVLLAGLGAGLVGLLRRRRAPMLL